MHSRIIIFEISKKIVRNIKSQDKAQKKLQEL